MSNKILCCYDNCGYLHFVFITREEFEKEEKGNYVNHEPIRLSTLEELSSYLGGMHYDACTGDPEDYYKLARLYYSITNGVKLHKHPAMSQEYYNE